MEKPAGVKSLEVEITNASGLHARSAARLAAMANEAGAPVFMTRGAATVDASSILDLLSLACPQGAKITLTISDPADEAILNKMVALVQSGFGE